jgi:hypothetical protein
VTEYPPPLRAVTPETSDYWPNGVLVTEHECSDPSCILCVRETWCQTCDDWVPDDEPCHHIRVAAGGAS